MAPPSEVEKAVAELECRLSDTFMPTLQRTLGPPELAKRHLKARADLLALVAAERDEAREWAVKAVREVEARERIMTCVWCGKAWPPMTPTSQAPILLEHGKSCEKSPLAEALRENAQLRERLRVLEEGSR